jgi:decaprenyl-phosphate phosphoribosyltransferase
MTALLRSSDLRPAPAPGLPAALLRTARPRQWPKNALVFAAPAAAGALLVPAVAATTAAAAAIFVVASAATYFINDAVDVAADRHHPTKRQRPVAAGLLAPRAALAIGVGLALLAPVLALPLGGRLAGVVALYLALTLGYSFWLKHQPVLDILAVAGGFVLRAVAGGIATGLPLSNWFLLVVLFGSLFLVTGKRLAEAQGGGVTARATLEIYPREWLQQIATLALVGVVLTYATWALQYPGKAHGSWPLALSVVPFLAAMLRYSLLVARGAGEEPEQLLSSDRFLLVAGLVWAALVGGGLYLG